MRSRSAMRLGLALVTLTASAAAGALPAHAATANCVAPPGTSGIDQYCETVPAAGGDTGTRGGGRGGHPLSHSVPRRTATGLRNAGPVGKAVLSLPSGIAGQGAATQSGAGGGAVGKGGAHGKGSNGRSPTNRSKAEQSTPSGKSDNPLQAIRSAVSTGTSAGEGLVWIFVALGLVMSGLAWLSYRRSTN
jgi:hypothetical protein